MAITSYPRVTIQGSGAAQNPQNGTGLMILNPSTNKYEAATAATFAGGGGGGNATAANQSTQIEEAQNTNDVLNSIDNKLISSVNGISIANLLFDDVYEESTAQILRVIQQTQQLIYDKIFNIDTETTIQTNYLLNISNKMDELVDVFTAFGGKVVIVDSSTGNVASVTANKLQVNTGA